jgi:undecaprenyl-diphosphatase
MTLLQILLLAAVQGAAELLPVSSSAHVIVAAKLMGLDPTTPEMTLLLVMLHTGTMFAVILYFWKQWRQSFFQTKRGLLREILELVLEYCLFVVIFAVVWLIASSFMPHAKALLLTELIELLFLLWWSFGAKKPFFFAYDSIFKSTVLKLINATAITFVVGEGLMKTIEKIFGHGQKIEPEQFFSHLELIAPALLAAGLLILIAGWLNQGDVAGRAFEDDGTPRPGLRQASVIGVVQGLCLPFRGFSRSGATISAGLLQGVARQQAEAFSFALAVLLTPPVVLREVLRLIKMRHLEGGAALGAAAVPSLIGMVMAFFAGLLALKWLSQWLERGKWYLFGVYCVAASIVVGVLHHAGY